MTNPRIFADGAATAEPVFIDLRRFYVGQPVTFAELATIEGLADGQTAASVEWRTKRSRFDAAYLLVVAFAVANAGAGAAPNRTATIVPSITADQAVLFAERAEYELVLIDGTGEEYTAARGVAWARGDLSPDAPAGGGGGSSSGFVALTVESRAFEAYAHLLEALGLYGPAEIDDARRTRISVRRVPSGLAGGHARDTFRLALDRSGFTAQQTADINASMDRGGFPLAS